MLIVATYFPICDKVQYLNVVTNRYGQVLPFNNTNPQEPDNTNPQELEGEYDQSKMEQVD